MTLQGTLLLAAYASLALWAAGHALLTRGDSRAAWGWIAACWLFPLGGAVLYYLLGSNRMQRRARRLRAGEDPAGPDHEATLQPLGEVHPDELRELLRIGRAMSHRALRAGNRVEVLFNGEQAYPAMLDAIARAQRSVCLSSYLFENRGVALEFVDALAAAHLRGVQVRVVVDGVADLYYWPRASALLARRGVPVARFLPPRLLPPMLHINLRNHRKLLVVDEGIAFLGGMNIGDHHVVARWRRDGIADLHFRVSGPVVADLAEVFEGDWASAARQPLRPRPAPPPPAGEAACRVLTDGPDHDLDRLVLVLLGALASAHRVVRIMTPYFLPPAELAGALQAAALRGVDVRVLVPQKSDQAWVDWAARRGFDPLLRNAVRIRERPPPFAHSKLFIVDDFYLQVGSANLDARSLRLNFELMLEAFDPPLVGKLAAHFDDAWATARPLDAQALARRPLWRRLRDSFFWLFSAWF